MPVVSCEKQLHIAGMMAVALVLPIAPFAYFIVQGVFPMPSTLMKISRANGGIGGLPPGPVLQYACCSGIFLLFIATTVLFVCSHYIRCFLIPCCFCSPRCRKRDNFVWVRKDLLNKYYKILHAQEKYPGDGDRIEILLSHLINKVMDEPGLESRPQLFQYQNLQGKLKDIHVTTWLDNNQNVVAMHTPDDILLDQQMGGHLLKLEPDKYGGMEVPNFEEFYVSRHCYGSLDKNKKDMRLQVDTFVNIEKIFLNPEKALRVTKGSQRLVACCEAASRDASRMYHNCGGVAYRFSRSLHAALWTLCVMLFLFFLAAIILIISLAVFVAPEKVLPYYTFVFSAFLTVKTQFKYFQCLRKLEIQADDLTSKMRVESEGVAAIFNDEGQCLGLGGDCGTKIARG